MDFSFNIFCCITNVSNNVGSCLMKKLHCAFVPVFNEQNVLIISTSDHFSVWKPYVSQNVSILLFTTKSGKSKDCTDFYCFVTKFLYSHFTSKISILKWISMSFSCVIIFLQATAAICDLLSGLPQCLEVVKGPFKFCLCTVTVW